MSLLVCAVVLFATLERGCVGRHNGRNGRNPAEAGCLTTNHRSAVRGPPARACAGGVALRVPELGLVRAGRRTASFAWLFSPIVIRLRNGSLIVFSPMIQRENDLATRSVHTAMRVA